MPAPRRAVDIAAYAGLWYELARYDVSFQRGCEAVTAQYRALPDGLIEVINICRDGTPSGPERSVTGKAKVVPDSNGAKLKVSFFGPFYFGDYWVLDRAPDYSWSIVGEGSGRYLWILSRTAKVSDEQYVALVSRVRELGYNVDMLRKTQH